MKPQDVVKLSKLMSLALRHDPTSLDLELDEAGWVNLADLAVAIAAQPRWRWVGIEHIKTVSGQADDVYPVDAIPPTFIEFPA